MLFLARVDRATEQFDVLGKSPQKNVRPSTVEAVGHKRSQHRRVGKNEMIVFLVVVVHQDTVGPPPKVITNIVPQQHFYPRLKRYFQVAVVHYNQKINVLTLENRVF